MDGREGMSLSGSPASYYYNRGGVSVSESSHVPGSGQPGPTPAPPGFKTQLNPTPNPSSGNLNSNPSHTYPPHNSNAAVSSSSPMTPNDSNKKKRGRPRKYGPGSGPDGSNMSLALSPMSPTPSSGALVSTGPQKGRGRPRGSGWKQQLAPLGEWMNSSAGLAFTPHIIHIGVGEDVAAKILLFAQQRPRALCILSATGAVSSVAINQPVTSTTTTTYEGRFDILCLSGSYLLAETGGPRNRTGGLSISFCSPEGHIMGGAIGGKLIASTPIQVVACSFVYGGGNKSKTKPEVNNKEEEAPNSTQPQPLQTQTQPEPPEKSSTPPVSAATPQDNSAPSGGGGGGGGGGGDWPPGSKNSVQTEIDLTRG